MKFLKEIRQQTAERASSALRSLAINAWFLTFAGGAIRGRIACDDDASFKEIAISTLTDPALLLIGTFAVYLYWLEAAR